MDESEKQIREEAKKSLKIYAVICLIFLIAFLIYFIFIKPPIDKKNELKQCKIDAWEDCGLVFNYDDVEENCYRIEYTNDTQWLECQNITHEQQNCWLSERYKCDNNIEIKIES